MGHFAPRARHVGPVAAVEATHFPGALAHRGAHAVHGGIAAADHRHVLAGGIQGAVVEGRHGVAQALAVRGGQVVERRLHVVEAGTRQLEVARLVDAGGDQQGVMALAQFAQGHVASDVAVQVVAHAGVLDQLGAALDHVLFELEIRDAVDQQAADPVVAVVDGHLVALAAQLLGGRQAGRTGADDADRLAALAQRLDRLHPALLPGGVGDVLLDRADGDGAVAGLLDDAVAFAEPVLRADPAADLREVVGRLADLVGLLEPARGSQHQPVGDVVMHRAMDLAERHAALGAAPGLLGRAGAVEFAIDLAEILAPVGRRPLVGHASVDLDELQHLVWHARSSSP